MMLYWLLLIYAVDTHDLIAKIEHHYATQQVCEDDRDAAAQPGRTYGVCIPSMEAMPLPLPPAKVEQK
jgi:hypothetical protein